MAERAAPNPPTITTEAIDKAVASSALSLNARLDGMSKAFEVFQADLTRVPTVLDRAISGLRELLEARMNGIDHDLLSVHKALRDRDAAIDREVVHLRELTFGRIDELSSVTTERFAGVAAQFSERDTRTDQRAGDTKLAVDAAFAAAKEATSKIEAGFTKSIDGQQELLKATTAATSATISDLKDRVTAIESRTQGIGVANQDNRAEKTDTRGLMFAIIGALIGVGGVLIAAGTLIAMVITRSH